MTEEEKKQRRREQWRRGSKRYRERTNSEGLEPYLRRIPKKCFPMMDRYLRELKKKVIF